MLYLSLFCLNLSYKSLDVYNSGGGVVPNSDVYKYSDPKKALSPASNSFAKLGHLPGGKLAVVKLPWNLESS